MLKPLGLNSLLNRTCRDPVPTEHDQVAGDTAGSSNNTDSAKLRFVRSRERAHGVATQCVCLLGKEIGFAGVSISVAQVF